MAQWRTKLKIKHLFTHEEDYESIQKSMNDIADAIENGPTQIGIDLKPFRNIPKGDSIFKPVDYANKLIDRLYDYADDERIWIE